MNDWHLQPARDLHLSGLERYRHPLREHGVVSSLLRLGWWTGIRLLLGIVNRLEVRGRQHLPADGPFVLVANHESHLDALVIASAVPLCLRDKLFPLAAGDVFFETPALAAFAAHCLNALPVWRKNAGRHGLTDLRRRLLEENAVYILFPEGGRSRDGQMKPFKAGVGMLIAGTPVPVVPCYLDGPLEAFPPGSRCPRWRKVRLVIGPARQFNEVGNDRAGWDHITTTLEEDVRALGETLSRPASRGSRRT
jgi:1-acyl-sn-glycerol-3-phosphate acyltransferase